MSVTVEITPPANQSVPQLGILISGQGGLMQRAIRLCQTGHIPARVAVVISSRVDNEGIATAQNMGVAVETVARSTFKDTASFSAQVWATVNKYTPLFGVLMLGWMPLLNIPPEWTNRVINTHPSLLPAFGGKGMYGQNVHQAILTAGVKVTGFTFHFVDNIYDHGPIIYQAGVEVVDGDTAETLEQRVISAQHTALASVLTAWVTNNLKISNDRVAGAPPAQWVSARELG